MRIHFAPLPLVTALLFCATSAFAVERMGPVLVSLDGATTLTVVAADGTRREAKLDEHLQTGDVLETGPGTSLTVAFEEGAQVVVANNTKVRIGEEAEIAGEPKVASVEVQDGDVRALVETYTGAGNPEVKASSVPTLKSHRFVIRTRNAIMGVRGTDFVVMVKDDRLAVNTFSGTVEVASDLKAFGEPGMVSVGEGRSLTADGTKAFVIEEFLKDFYKKHPHLEKLYAKAQREAKDGTLKSKFTALRTHFDEELKLKKGDNPGEIEFTGKKAEDKSDSKPGPKGRQSIKKPARDGN